MKKKLIYCSVVVGLLVSCSSKPVDNASDEPVDLDKLTFCDCKNAIFDIKGELQRTKDSTELNDLKAELELFEEKCEQYLLKENATEKERVAYQLDWNKQAAECK